MPTRNTVRSCVVRAPAKVNLTLQILGRRSDGFHDLRSLAIGVGLYDELRVERGQSGGITINCSESSLQTPDNLAVRAARRLAAHVAHSTAMRISLEKSIPPGAGLGGGSSDAAAALRACQALLGSNLSREELAAIGAEIGSDVPLFFYLPSAVITGRGEHVAPTPLAWRGWVLLVLPPVASSTAAVYGARAESDSHADSPVAVQEICRCRSADEIAERSFNELEPALFRIAPQLGDLFESLALLDIGRPRVSGSGSAMYMLFDDPQAAARAASIVQDRITHVKALVAPAPVGEVPVECLE